MNSQDDQPNFWVRGTDLWGNKVDIYGNKTDRVGDTRDATGTLVGLGAPSPALQRAAGVGPNDSRWVANEKVHRMQMGQLVAGGVAPQSSRSRGPSLRSTLLFMLLAACAIVVAIFGYDFIKRYARDPFSQARLIDWALAGDLHGLELAAWERFAAHAPKGSPLGMDPHQLALLINEAATSGKPRLRRFTDAQLNAAAWHCIASDAARCLAPAALRGASGALYTNAMIGGIPSAALAHLRSDSARRADLDLTISQEAALCVRSLHMHPGKSLDRCIGPLDWIKKNKPGAAPLSAAASARLEGWRWRVAAFALSLGTTQFNFGARIESSGNS